MRALIQRVKRAEVEVNNCQIGAIKRGLLVFLGVCDTDTEELANKFWQKIKNLRIFEDENGKTNLSLDDVDGSVLIISQFTLYANCRKGNRPSFVAAGQAAHANALYEYMLKIAMKDVKQVEHGEFGADMSVSLVNDGPFTIYLDSKELGLE